MKIIKRSAPENTGEVEIKCTSCKSELQYNILDTITFKPEKENEYSFVQCPVCGNQIKV